MSTATSTPNLNYAPTRRQPGFFERINFRLVLVVLVAMLMVSYPVYVYLDSLLTGGIKSVGNGYKQVDLKAMSMFAFDPATSDINDVPKKWRDLDGQKVILYGEQWSPFSTNAGAGFELCYSIAKCCVGGPPKVQHFVHTRVLPGRNLDYYGGAMVKAVGTLHVKVERDPGTNYVTAIYSMDLENLEPVE
jgi:hypothetical protein